MDPHTFSEGQKVKHIILGLIWQILAVSLHTNFIIFTLFDEKDQRYDILSFYSIAFIIFQKYLMSGIHLQNVPGLILLLKDGETNKDLAKFSPEQILLRWVNYQLQKVIYFLYLRFFVKIPVL